MGAKFHHYVPAFLLAGFTDSGTRTGRIKVFNKLEDREFSRRADEVGGEMHLYRLDATEHLEAQGIDTAAVEKYFSDEVEGPAALVVEQLRADFRLPRGRDMNAVLKLFASLSVRTPERLAWLSDLWLKPVEVMHNMLEERGMFPRSGDPAVDEILKNGIERGTIKLTLKRNFLLQEMLGAISVMERLLRERTWAVVRAPDGAPDLITADTPLILDWTIAPPRLESPGFGTAKTFVYVPLGARVGMFGYFPPHTKPEPNDATLVRYLNRRMLAHAKAFVYHREGFQHGSFRGEVVTHTPATSK